jgi:hypothetical protein
MTAAHVSPRDVDRLRGCVWSAIASLGARAAALPPAVMASWMRLAHAPVGWANAHELVEEICDVLARIQLAARELTTTGQAAPTAPADASPTHGLVTPGDVLSYRGLWDEYVMGTVRAGMACADAWDAAAAGAAQSPPITAPASINLAQFGAHPPDAATLRVLAQSERASATALETLWNLHANTPDEQIVLNAAAILQDFQSTVLKAGQVYQTDIRKQCPNIPLPAPPGLDVQARVIGQIEGLGILAHGLLQLLGEGTGGALETLGAIGKAASGVVEAGTSILKSPGAIVGGLAAIAVILVVLSRK